MKILKIVLVILLVAGLSFGGYKLYGLYQNWQEKQYNEIEFLKRNQDSTIQKITELSTTLTRIVNKVVKIETQPKTDNTYEGLKKEVIALKENEDENKEKIAELKKELSVQRKAFLASDNTILISGKNDETYLIYRDTEGNLQPASDNIEKVIEHKELSENVPILAEEKIAIDKTSYNLKAGGYYTLDKTYGVIFSKEIFTVKNYSLNGSLLISDFDDVKFAVGGDVGYLIGNNLEVGIGYNTDKDYYFKLQYSF